MMYHGFNTNNMTKLEAKSNGYTRSGLMYRFIPIYLKHNFWDIDVVGKNKFWDILLDIFLFIDGLFGMSDGFYIWEEEKL